MRPQHYGAAVDLTGTWRAASADETLRRTFHHPGFDDDAWAASRRRVLELEDAARLEQLRQLGYLDGE